MESEREQVFFADASDLNFGVGRWPQTCDCDCVAKIDEREFTLVGFSRNIDGEILFAVYSNRRGALLRVYND